MRFPGLSRKLVAGAIFVTVGVGVPMSAVSETLADAMVSAYKHSGLMEQNRALLRAADEDVAIAVSSLRPILSWSSTTTRSWGRSHSSVYSGVVESAGTSTTVALAAELMLYDFGRTRLQIDIAKETVLSTRQVLLSVEQGVLLRAAAAFLEVRRQTAVVGLRQNNVRVITEELRAARDRFEVGEVTRTDVSLAEARLAAARGAKAGAQGALARANEEYRAVTGHRHGALSTPPRVPSTAKSVEAAKAVAVRNHPGMIKAQHDVAAAELAVLLAEAGKKPTVKLSGQYGLTENFKSDNFSKGGSVSIIAGGPIYQGGRLAAVERRAMAQRDAVRGGLHTTRHQIALDVGNAWAQLQVARAIREATDRQVRASRVAFRGVREEAKLGARTTLDVLDAEQELLNAQADEISAVIDTHVAAYSLLSAMGLLTAERLKLNVPSYDPAAYYNMVKTAPVAASRQGKKLDNILRALSKE